MTKWIIFDNETESYEVEDIDDVDEHINEQPFREVLITVDRAKELIEDDKQV